MREPVRARSPRAARAMIVLKKDSFSLSTNTSLRDFTILELDHKKQPYALPARYAQWPRLHWQTSLELSAHILRAQSVQRMDRWKDAG